MKDQLTIVDILWDLPIYLQNSRFILFTYSKAIRIPFCSFSFIYLFLLFYLILFTLRSLIRFLIPIPWSLIITTGFKLIAGAIASSAFIGVAIGVGIT